MTLLHLIECAGLSIFEQLQMEEALLRLDNRNWCLINTGSPPAIVMGISGKPEELIDPIKREQLPLPLIRRFSGGGTVVVDEETLFVTFIFQKEAHDFPAYPEPILRWSEEFYARAFKLFSLRENDYVIGSKKCGGNAQYIKKDRWLHHTTFLWGYQKKHMDLLLVPRRTPPYRLGRSHDDFLCCLKDHFPSKENFTSDLKAALAPSYQIHKVPVTDLAPLLAVPHRKATALL